MSYYRQLNGFDERYFMYCEDIDICYRSCKIHGKRVMYFPNIKAVHLSKGVVGDFFKAFLLACGKCYKIYHKSTVSLGLEFGTFKKNFSYGRNGFYW